MTSPEWRLLSTGFRDGFYNMAVDEAIMHFHGQGRVPPTLRLYGWKPPCLSLGYSQSAAREIDLERLARLDMDLVRRPTGGRAILHEEEVTYSVIVGEKDPLVSGPVWESYRKISTGLLEGLRLLGAEAASEKPSPEKSPAGKTGACFDVASQYEITVRGRKLVGSAQRRKGGVILQQGTILLAIDVDKLFSLLKRPLEDERETLKKNFKKRVTSLKEALGRDVSFEEVSQKLRLGFEKALGVILRDGELTPEEERLAQTLVREKYSRQEWNLSK